MAEHRTTSRFKRLPEDERRIGLRLLYARRLADASQERIAELSGLTTAQLANIEAARVPLKAANAMKLCEILEIHPHWLFSGAQEKSYYDFDIRTANWLNQVFAANKSLSFWDALVNIAWFVFGSSADAVAIREDFVENNKIPVLKGFSRKNELTSFYESVKLKPVKPQMPKLLERVKKATTKKGSKSQLAKWLGVPLASLSQWLSGEREPGGEYALRLLYWVEQQEHK